jgi:hypothetical protein
MQHYSTSQDPQKSSTETSRKVEDKEKDSWRIKERREEE